jgi:hypothetical protein
VLRVDGRHPRPRPLELRVRRLRDRADLAHNPPKSECWHNSTHLQPCPRVLEVQRQAAPRGPLRGADGLPLRL